MRLPIVLTIACLLFVTGCAKKPGALSWKPDPDPGLLAVDAEAFERAQLEEALITLRRVHFAYDSVELTPDSRDALVTAREKLGNNPSVRLFVEGHADERGTTEYNIGLGERRANVVADYLAALGVSTDRLHVVSYGEERPLVDAPNEAAWAKNRRVDFRIMQGEFEIVVEEGRTVAHR